MTEKKEKEELTFENGVRINLGKNLAYPVFGSWPKDKWDEYMLDVENNYSGVRWAKAMHDHIVAKQAKVNENAINMFLELKHEIALLKLQNENDNKVIDAEPVNVLGKKND